MKLVEYVPLFLKNVREFNEIFDVEDVELDNLKIAIKKVLQEVIVKRANSYGLERYEKIYGITNVSNSIEVRRMNILFKMNSKVPYTFFWLIDMLNELIGEENYTIDLDNENHILTIKILEIYKNMAEELKESLRKQIPANLVLDVNIFQTESMSNKYICGIVHAGDFIEIKQEV